MRLFVAVDVPDDIKQSIERDVVDLLRPVLTGARWSRPEGRHLTLKFLGEVADDRLEEVVDALRPAVANHEPFTASFGTVGGFPNLRRPRVLWTGIERGAEELRAVAADVDTSLSSIGFAPEERGFTAHLTLARFPQPAVIDPPEVHVPADPFPVAEVTVYRSQLHPKGARYTALEGLPLLDAPRAL